VGQISKSARPPHSPGANIIQPPLLILAGTKPAGSQAFLNKQYVLLMNNIA